MNNCAIEVGEKDRRAGCHVHRDGTHRGVGVVVMSD